MDRNRTKLLTFLIKICIFLPEIVKNKFRYFSAPNFSSAPKEKIPLLLSKVAEKSATWQQ